MPHCVERLSIIFAMLLNLQLLKKLDVLVCGALTLQTKLSDLTSLNIDLSVLNTAGLGFTRKNENILQSQYLNLMAP